jgi:dihydroorotate dehydrogenase electron transfer subunit
MLKTSLPKPITISKIVKENYRTKTFITDVPINGLPGQFIMVWFPGIGEKPFSLTDIKPLTFTVMKVGQFTSHLVDNLKTGQKLGWRGPFGKGVFTSQPGKKVLIAGGCGCVPLYFLAKTLMTKKNTSVIIGAKNKQELLFIDRFKRLGFPVITTTDDGSLGYKGFTTDRLEELVRNGKIDTVYACGPMVMLEKIWHICQKFGIKYQLSLEAMMKCGFGVCGSCSINGKLVCQDGPVFNRWPK